MPKAGKAGKCPELKAKSEISKANGES